MEEVLRDIGLRYAETFPVALAAVLGPLVLVAWLASKAKDLEPSARNLAWFALAAVALMVVVQWPAAYNEAKSDCRKQFAQSGGRSSSISLGGTTASVPSFYAYSKCAKVWPRGPDG